MGIRLFARVKFHEISEVADELIASIESAETASLDEPVRMYLREIGNVPRLTEVQETALARSLIAGDENAKLRLTEANLRRVVSLATEYVGRGVPLLDMIQEGNLGLIHAVEKFDPGPGYRFSAYANWWIWQAVLGRIVEVTGAMTEPGVRDYWSTVSNKNDEAWPALPRILIIEERPGRSSLSRYATDARPTGETWHVSTAKAKSQAHFEFGGALGEWVEIPEEVQDAAEFALQQPE